MQTPRTKQQGPPSPQPRAVQHSKRRQSGKSPAGDGADLVTPQLPAPANHRVSKRSHASQVNLMDPSPIRLALSVFFIPVPVARLHSTHDKGCAFIRSHVPSISLSLFSFLGVVYLCGSTSTCLPAPPYQIGGLPSVLT
jgi:hypothetical protein